MYNLTTGRRKPGGPARTMVLLLAISAMLVAPAMGRECRLEIDSNDRMQFDKKEMVVPGDCTKVTIVLTHSGRLPKQVMGHNWVLTETQHFMAVNDAGIKAGIDAEYVPPNDDRVIAYTPLIGGGEETSVTFDTSKLKRGGDYTFFCSFPGHAPVMNGKLVFK